ncbi:MAG: septum formation initiator family protein [Caldilineaceae bacterium]|nr:septum formation initiator family protein [Caldilineaceae bacterium]MCB9140433.1 septum formation initiator family protein [Caldilineaceae bacterium]
MTQRKEPMQAAGRRPILLLFLLLCVLFITGYVGRLGQLAGLRADITAKQVELNAALDRQAALLDEQAYTRTEQYTDEVMRDQFGMSRPGDKLIVVVPSREGDGAPAAAESASPPAAEADAIWRQWRALFAPEE